MTFHRARLSDFNAAFAAGKSTANDTISPCQSLDKQLINLKESTTSNKQVLTQADLDTEIMVLDYCYWFILHYYNSATKTYSKIFNVFFITEIHYKRIASFTGSAERMLSGSDGQPCRQISSQEEDIFH